MQSFMVSLLSLQKVPWEWYRANSTAIETGMFEINLKLSHVFIKVKQNCHASIS